MQGSGDNGEITFLDLIAILGFFVGLQNLDMNISQNDLQRTEEGLNKALRKEVEAIHNHLQAQDEKIDKILGGINVER